MQSDSENGVAAAMVAAMSRCPNSGDPSQTLMRAYMDKLRELVPQCPKNRNVSKLELIQHVIDYINDLQDTLQGGNGSDSPPPSPRLDALSFTEAFSHLGFADPSKLSETKLHQVEDGSVGGHSYTSDGSSDYDSRGSSPVNHSDTDNSSDELSHSYRRTPSIHMTKPVQNYYGESYPYPGLYPGNNV